MCFVWQLGCRVKGKLNRHACCVLPCQVNNKKIARLGVTLVYEQWHFFMEDHPGIKYRSHPEDKLYDLHVNVVESIDTPAVRDCPRPEVPCEPQMAHFCTEQFEGQLIVLC
jgi:hypothetical protein